MDRIQWTQVPDFGCILTDLPAESIEINCIGSAVEFGTSVDLTTRIKGTRLIWFP